MEKTFLLYCILAMLIFTYSKTRVPDTNSPCDDFKNWQIQYVPARCVSIYTPDSVPDIVIINATTTTNR